MIALLALLATLALAAPPRPPPAAPVPGEAPAVVRVVGGYLVPDSELADLLADREWALQLESDYTADEAAWAGERLAYDARIEAAKVPWYSRPGLCRAEGAVGVGLLVVASAVVVVEVQR